MSRKSFYFLCLGAVCAYLIYAGLDWRQFWSSLSNIQPWWLAASIIATLLTYLTRAFRWQVLLDPVKSVPMGSLISINVLGFASIYLIGRAGELVRPLWLTRQERIPWTASLATIIVERFLDILMLLILFALALLAVQLPAATEHTLAFMKTRAWMLLVGCAAAMVFLFVFRSNVDRIVQYVPFAKIVSLMKNFAEGLAFLDKPSSFGLAIMHSIFVWIIIVLQFWFMLLGMNIHFSISAATLVMVGAAIGSIVQLPGIGGGFQGGYFFFMTVFFAIPKEQAFATALIAWVSQLVPTVLLGAIYMVSHHLSLKDLRTATAE